MAAKTFLDLVNEAIYETKASLDPLTTANFASPPRTILYNRFKSWVNMGYRELQMKRKEWFFRKERATVEVYPRLLLAGLTYTPVLGDILEGASSGIEFTVVTLAPLTEDIEGDSLIEMTVGVVPSAGFDLQNLILRETINKINGSPLTNIGYLKGLGRYTFNDLVVQLEQIDMESINAHRPASVALSEGLSLGANTTKVIFVPWHEWGVKFEIDTFPNWTTDLPQYVTQAPDGTYEFYPMPATSFYVSFDFTRSLAELVNYQDTPASLPDRYHEYLMWRAVQEYADFDNQSKLFMRAQKHVEEYLYWLGRDELPQVGFASSKFNR
jgi:hypothetical protein